MKLYKVLREEDGKLFSAVIDDVACVEYKIGEYSEAPKWLQKNGYHLTAFQSLEGAEEFIQNNKHHSFNRLWKIYKCRGEIILQHSQLPYFLDVYGLDVLFKKGQRNIGCLNLWPVNWPSETIMCQKLTPICEVKGEMK